MLPILFLATPPPVRVMASALPPDANGLKVPGSWVRVPIRLGSSGSRGATAVYGLAHFGKSLFWYTSEILFAFFVTEVSGLPASAMGWVIAAGLLVSVLVDLVLANAFRQGLGRVPFCARLQGVGAVVSGAALGVLFMSPMINESCRLAYVALLMVVFRFAYALYDLPQNVLLSLATASSRGRSNVAALRLFFSGLAALTVTMLVGPLVTVLDRDMLPERFLVLAALISAVALVTATALWLVLSRGVEASGAASSKHVVAGPQPSAAPWRFPRDMQVLMWATFLVSLTTSTFSRLEPYFVAYVLDTPTWSGAMITSMALGMTLSQMGWAWLMSRHAWHRVFASASVLLTVSTLVFLAAAVSAPWLAVCAAFVFGVGSGGLGTVMWAAYGDAVNKQSTQGAGPAFAWFAGMSKCGLAIGIVLLGYFLHTIDYRGDDRLGVLWAMTIWPAIGGFVCALLGLTWRTRSFSARD